jgi:hypothetical protein
VNILVAQLNKAATDLPGILVTYWLAYIHIFDFEVQHIPRYKHTAADGLSRHLRTESDDSDKRNEEDIEDFLDSELVILSIIPVRLTPEALNISLNSETLIKVLNKNYSEES